MKKFIYFGRYVVGTAVLLQLLIMITFASGSIRIMETHTGESDIAIYIKGIEEDASSVKISVGTAACTSVENGRLSELKYPIKTLVMLDNSLSIPESARASVAGILQNIISDRESYEEISIATFDEEIRYLTDYTSDYTTLKSAVNDISYQNLETHLTNVLYDLLLKEYTEKTEDAYWRIIVISDGIDDKSVNSTRDELYVLMKEQSVPIYTIGMQTNKNDEQLANLFALSRLSNADSFLLNNMADLLDINMALNTDRSIVRFSIFPQGELMDGSRKSVKIAFPTGDSLSVEITMPQQVQIEESDSDSGSESIEESSLSPETEFAVDSTTKAAIILPVVVISILILIAAIMIAVVLLSKCKKTNDDTESEDQKRKEEKAAPEDEPKKYRHTMMRNSGSTLYLFGNNASHNIILTDMDSPVRTFSYSIKDMVVIGADTNCEISINDDECISWRHCRIEVENGKFYLEDMQSTNGTFLNDVRIFLKTEIISGDIVQIGDTKLKFEVQ